MSGQGARASILHLLLGGDSRARDECRKACSSQDTVLLLDAGVMALADPDGAGLDEFPCRLVVSAPDAQARAMAGRAGGNALDLLSDEGIIALIESHRHCLSWR